MYEAVNIATGRQWPATPEFPMFEDRVFQLRGAEAPGGILCVRRKQPANPDLRRSPVLLVHGATLSASLFDLPLAGYSLTQALAECGRMVYALDIRGYGYSLGPGVMDEPPDRNPPFADAFAALDDIGAAVKFALEQHRESKLDLIGFSWGTIPCARYAGENPDKIAHLALYAPIHSEARPIWSGSERQRLGAYRLVSLESIARRWEDELPKGPARSVLRDDPVFPIVFEVIAALDPAARSRRPYAFRCPNGAIKDLMDVTNGKSAFDPTKLTMPVLLVRGNGDLTSTDADARNLLSLIPSPVKHYKVITPGSHFLCIEDNRRVLYDELSQFLDQQLER
jgi:pimeloyl-ACP methyl ester carboxylesterase